MNINLNIDKTFHKCFCVVFILLGLNSQSTAQSVSRQCVASSGGTYLLSNGMLISQTIGQSYGTKADYSNGVSYRPGFQQPVLQIQLIHTTISLKVFPNPAVNSVTIQSQNVIKDALIQVVEMSGKILIRQQMSELTTYTFNCEDWANGNYIITVSDAQNHLYSSKLIILK